MTDSGFLLFQAELDAGVLRRDAAKLARPVDVEKLRAIQVRFRREQKQIERVYRRDFDKRMEWASRALARRHGVDLGKIAKEKTPRDTAMFVKLNAAAKREVEGDHKRRMASSYQREAKELRDLLDAARDRENGPQPNAPPKRITDQRSASDRLSITRSR